jgi:hypothetical protein
LRRLAVLGALPIWFLCMIVPALRPLKLRTELRQFGTFVLGWLLIVGLAALDPTTFTDWFAD